MIVIDYFDASLGVALMIIGIEDDAPRGSGNARRLAASIRQRIFPSRKRTRGPGASVIGMGRRGSAASGTGVFSALYARENHLPDHRRDHQESRRSGYV